jgi:hypothetical protein
MNKKLGATKNEVGQCAWRYNPTVNPEALYCHRPSSRTRTCRSSSSVVFLLADCVFVSLGFFACVTSGVWQLCLCHVNPCLFKVHICWGKYSDQLVVIAMPLRTSGHWESTILASWTSLETESIIPASCSSPISSKLLLLGVRWLFYRPIRP